MALTAQEQAQVRQYLGWSARWAQFDGALVRSFSAIGSFPEDEALVRANLAECLRIDAALEAAEKRLKANKVGTIELNRAEMNSLREQGEMYLGRIAACLGVEVRESAFRPDAPRFRAGPWGITGGGNAQRHG